MLKCETNTPDVDNEVREAFEASPRATHHGTRIDTFFEHGQWFVTCLPCGAQWSVHDATPGDFWFEMVTAGDDDGHQSEADKDEDA